MTAPDNVTAPDKLCDRCPPDPDTDERPVVYEMDRARQLASYSLGCLKAIRCPQGGTGWHLVTRFS